MAAPKKRSYSPGFRNKDAFGRTNDSRWAWVKTHVGEFIIWVEHFIEPETEEPTDEIMDIKLVNTGKQSAVTWNLTNCTEEELIALKDLLDTAIEWALPIARQRDKDAKDAFDNGDDSHYRIYRAVPQLVYRKRPEPEHSEGVCDGPSNVPPLPAQPPRLS